MKASNTQKLIQFIFRTLMSLYFILLCSLGLNPLRASSITPSAGVNELQQDLFLAYQLADCSREKKLYEAYHMLSQSQTVSQDMEHKSISASAMMTCDGCPNISLVSLDGVPGFPTVDLLNVCSVPDTASILIYNSGDCMMKDVELMITFDEGLSYGGFVFKDSNSTGAGTVSASDLSDLSQPIFTITEIESSVAFIVNLAVQADCSIDAESEKAINFDGMVSFTYDDVNGSTADCNETITEVGAYNSGIRISVVNVLSVEPQEIILTEPDVPLCQRITVSQDGINSFLEDFQFQITGVDMSTYNITSIDINDIAVSPADYVIDPTSQTVSLQITEEYFPPNFHTGANGDLLFDTDERLFIDVCYSSNSCSTGTGFIMYNAFYGCNDEVCFDLSQMQGVVNFNPDFGATVNATSGNIQPGGICGDNMSYDVTLTSDNTDPLEGLWTDLVLKYEACLVSNTSIVNIAINGVTVPSNLVNITNGTVTIDLTQNTSDFDGSGGLSDEDGDGIFDDLLGGNSIIISTEVAIGCGDSSADCGSISCSLEQLEVTGKRNCGQHFQDFATIGGDGAVDFFYGAISSTTNVMTVPGRTVPISEEVVTVCDVWGASANGYHFDYTFAQENVTECLSSGGIDLIITVVATGGRLRDIRYTAGSATYQGATAGGVTSQYIIVPGGGGGMDTTALEIIIPGGDNMATDHDYFFNLDYRGDCYPDDYTSLTYRAVETCNSCDPAGCEIVRACGNAATWVDWNGCGCDCQVLCTIETLERTNYGYADKAMTIPLTAADVPEADRSRFLPGDTMYYRAAFEFLNADFLYSDDNFLWNLIVESPSNSGPVMLDKNNTTFGGWFWKNSATGVITELGVPDCMLNYPDATRTGYNAPSISVSNFGVDNLSSAWVDRNNDAYLTCDDNNVNPIYPPESAINYAMQPEFPQWDGNLTQRSSLLILWGDPEGCQDTGSRTDGTHADSYTNNCREEFLQQFPIQTGDFIYIDSYAPIVHNPAYDLNTINGVGNPSTMLLIPKAQFLGKSLNCNTFEIGRDCFSNAPYEGHLPGPITINPEIELSDCEVQVEYTFTLENPIPTVGAGITPWYANEYRPYMATEYLQFAFPTNMIYDADGVLVMPDGTEVPLPSQYLDPSVGNLNCVADGAGGLCCSAADPSSLASVRYNDADYTRAMATLASTNDELLSLPGTTADVCATKSFVHIPNDPFPHIPVGGADPCLSYGLKYNLSAICPENIESTDFELEYQFAEPYIGSLGGRLENIYKAPESGNETNPLNYAFIFPDNPFGTRCGEVGGPIGCISFYDKIFPHPVSSNWEVNPSRYGGTNVSTPDVINDMSGDFPALLPTLSNLLQADLEGENETNTYTVCAGTGGGTATHMNVTTDITLPSSVQLIDVQDLMGNSVAWTLVETLPNSQVYTFAMSDLAPGDCAEVVLITELLFCPVGLDTPTEICLSTYSSCLSSDKLALLNSSTAGLCNNAAMCYQYIAEEADVQVEWDPQPEGPYGLCEVISSGIRLKNVKLSTLTDIKQDFYFPSGINFVPGSWQVCYPGGPTNTGPCVSIPDPTANPSENSIFGSNYAYDEDGDWSSFIDQNGLPGILSSLDSNKVQFLFDMETVCDDFVSGTSVYTQTTGSDPCESTVTSMFAESEQIIIENADPRDFAQFFVFAEPAQANCGEEATLVLTYLNISPFGESAESLVCIDLETSTFDYMSGSVSWIAPTSHTPVFTEEMNGSITHICMDIPDGIGPGEAFQVSLDYSIPEDINCGQQDLGVMVTSEIMDQSCMAQDILCSVQVLNSVNPQIQIEFLPPLNVTEQQLRANCPNGDGTVDLCYDVTLSNPGDFYSGEVSIALIRDVNQNGILDDPIIDPKIADMSELVMINTDETVLLSGCLTVNESESCPVFLMVMQMTDCVCNSLDFYHDEIQPIVTDDLETSYTLCPGAPLGIKNCASWSYEVSPANGATINTSSDNDSLYITLNEGFGNVAPVILNVTSTNGGCSAVDFPIELYSLNDFTFGPFAQDEACTVGCKGLDLNIPSDYENSVTVEWIPNQYLDDHTSLTPTICDPQTDVNYLVSLTFDNGDGTTCEYTANYPVVVQEQVVEEVIENGDLCNNGEATIMAPTGYGNYVWTKVNSDGSTAVPQNSSSHTFTTGVLGTYYVEYGNLGDVCTIRSNTFMINRCPIFDLALTKVINTTATPAPYTAGSVVQFTITVHNQGEQDAYDVDVADYNPTGLGNASLVAGQSGVSANAPNDFTVDFVAIGGSVSFEIEAMIDPSFTGSSLINNAEITGGSETDGGPDAIDEDSTPDNNSMTDAETDNDNVITDNDDGSPQDNDSYEDDFDPAEVPVSILCEVDEISMTSNQCVDNGTPDNPSDDRVQVGIFVTGSGSTYTLSVDGGTTITPSSGTIGSPELFLLGPGTAGSGNTYTITVIDAADPSCNQTIVVQAPENCETVLPCPTKDCGGVTIQKNE